MTIAESGPPSKVSEHADAADQVRNSEVSSKSQFFPDAKLVEAALESTRIGVWSENSLDRYVVVAAYGQPA